MCSKSFSLFAFNDIGIPGSSSKTITHCRNDKTVSLCDLCECLSFDGLPDRQYWKCFYYLTKWLHFLLNKIIRCPSLLTRKFDCRDLKSMKCVQIYPVLGPVFEWGRNKLMRNRISPGTVRIQLIPCKPAKKYFKSLLGLMTMSFLSDSFTTVYSVIHSASPEENGNSQPNYLWHIYVYMCTHLSIYAYIFISEPTIICKIRM